MILTLIWRNLWRNKRRTLITMTSVTFAVMLAVTMKSLQKGVFDNLISNVVSFYSGYIQVHKKGYQDEQILDNSMLYSERHVQAIKNTARVSGITARLETFALVSSGTNTQGSMVIGTRSEEENNLTRLKSKIIRGTCFADHDQSVVLAEGLADKLQAQPGDTIILLGQGYQGNSAAGKYAVSGIAHFGSPQLNEMMIYMPLPAAQAFLCADSMVTTYAININQPSTLEKTASDIKNLSGEEYEVITWKKMMPDIENHIRADNADFYIFIGVLYLLIAFGIFGTLLMMMAERRYELGMLIAIGMKKMQVALMLIGETVMISLLGALAGLALSFPVVKYFQVNPIRFSGNMAEAYKKFGFDPVWPAALDADIFFTQTLIILCLALIISIFPLVSILRMDAVNAMKR